MNLTEERKAPLREKRLDEKRELLAMQFKGSIQVDVAFFCLVQAVVVLCNRNGGNASEASGNWCLGRSTRGRGRFCRGPGVLFPEKF